MPFKIIWNWLKRKKNLVPKQQVPVKQKTLREEHLEAKTFERANRVGLQNEKELVMGWYRKLTNLYKLTPREIEIIADHAVVAHGQGTRVVCDSPAAQKIVDRFEKKGMRDEAIDIVQTAVNRKFYIERQIPLTEHHIEKYHFERIEKLNERRKKRGKPLL